MVDLSRFRTSARPAINPPAPDIAHSPADPGVLNMLKSLETSPDAYEQRAINAQSIVPPGGTTQEALRSHLEVQTVEGDAETLAALGLEVVADEPETRETEPAPAPEASIVPAPSRKRRRAEKQEPRLDAHEAEVVNPPTLEGATTEAIMHELRDRGWSVTLVDRSGL